MVSGRGWSTDPVWHAGQGVLCPERITACAPGARPLVHSSAQPVVNCPALHALHAPTRSRRLPCLPTYDSSRRHRKEIIVFKEGYRSRSYCLSECTQVRAVRRLLLPVWQVCLPACCFCRNLSWGRQASSVCSSLLICGLVCMWDHPFPLAGVRPDHQPATRQSSRGPQMSGSGDAALMQNSLM